MKVKDLILEYERIKEEAECIYYDKTAQAAIKEANTAIKEEAEREYLKTVKLAEEEFEKNIEIKFKTVLGQYIKEMGQ